MHPDGLSVPDRPHEPDSCFDLDSAALSSPPLANPDYDLIAGVGEVLRIDAELLEDLKRALQKPPDLFAPTVGVGTRKVRRIAPLDIGVEDVENGHRTL